MDLKQLRYFCIIAEEGQVTRAAKKLHMAQPPLSYQLKSLEEELGVLLMERNGKKMELTEAGTILYERANSLLLQMEAAVSEVKEAGEGLSGLLSIGCVKTGFSYIPERIRFFREQYPNVSFRLHEGDSYRLAEDVRNRSIELALVRLPLDLNDFDCLPLSKDPFAAIVPEHLEMNSTIDMADLSELPLMLLHRVSGIGLFELVVNAFQKHGLKPAIVCQCPDAAMLMALVREGVGVAILPESTLRSFPNSGLKAVPIRNSELLSDCALIWLKDRYLSKKAVRFRETFLGEGGN
ncbi:LysR family transcriptional regulator [Bacillus sp. SJS]|uniref:LysR family transcriptional regulator n=1 Tax=Bacillus sp. SJS TaxID=1423321 RepID=UPI0004DD4F1F|nr:LysR family transcriptional regulator [Bacillus sp. SJS]KZZ83657.1 LysR family transcriptional regulator [Bacillus sp. SJS]